MGNNAHESDNSEEQEFQQSEAGESPGYGEHSISEEELNDLHQSPQIQELNEKYVRLYADFENFRRRVNREKEDLVKYGNESILYELLPALDNLELALKHAPGSPDSGLVQGVQMTQKELLRTLEKFGLSRIPADGKQFDPALHHAMMNVERDDLDDKMIAEEFRPGYLYRDKVLRPSLVAVSVKPKKEESLSVQNGMNQSEEADKSSDLS